MPDSELSLQLIGRQGKPPAAEEQEKLSTARSFLPGSILGANNFPEDVQFVFDHGQGSHFWDVSGNRYIDYILGAGTLVLGHAHPAVQKAVAEQATRGTHFFAYLNSISLTLAQTLMPLIPCAEKIRFTTSGSDSTFHAIRLSRAYTSREKILKFEGAYHGTHDYAQLSTTPSRTSDYPHPIPDTNGIPAAVQDLMLVCPYNDLDTLKAILSVHGKDIAAIIVEPIQRILSPKAGFLEGVRELTTQYGIVMIMDEVVTGFRYGLQGAQGYFNVTPDLATYGKIIGGGLPVGAIAGKAEIMDQADPVRKKSGDYVYQNGTLQGHPLGCAAALATIETLSQPGVYHRLFSQADKLRHGLQEIFDREKMGILVFGEGPMWHMLFTDKVPQQWSDIIATDLVKQAAFDTELLRQGIFVVPGMRRFISIMHTDDDLQQTFAAAERACRAFKSA